MSANQHWNQTLSTRQEFRRITVFDEQCNRRFDRRWGRIEERGWLHRWHSLMMAWPEGAAKRERQARPT